MRELAELRTEITRLAERNGPTRGVDGVQVRWLDRPAEPLGAVTEPVFALVAQGRKRSVLGDRVFEYGAGQYLVVTVDLPLTGEIVEAGGDEPFLAFGLPLRPAVITQLLLDAGGPPARTRDGVPSIATGDASPELVDAVVRRLRLVGSPLDQRILAAGVEREIHWRLLTGPHADAVRQIGVADSRLALVSRAIRQLQTRYAEPIRIDDLAAEAGLSTSSLNRHFRAVTEMSPLQYQKQLRLQHARVRLMSGPDDVSAIGHAVGYVSVSQFSREYRRAFGVSPGRDAARLRAEPVVWE